MMCLLLSSSSHQHVLFQEEERGICLKISSLPSPRPFPVPAAEPPASRRTPSPDLMQELYQHSRHPLDLRTHLTIVPSWEMKSEEKHGECIIFYQEGRHLQIKCRNCKGMKVCCTCVVGIYLSINSCPICRFRGEY